MAEPTLLFYCQHSLGIGHLTRSFALATALLRDFRIVFLNGGRLPEGVPVPAGLEIVDLPPLGMDDGHTVVSRDGARDVAQARQERQALICATVAATRPDVLLVELFPFGRKKFAGEILPLIRAVKRAGGRVVCSLRDILVDARPDQMHHDERARWIVDRYFDAVLVHADAAFARLEDSFRPKRVMRTPVIYTGFVAPEATEVGKRAAGRADHILVSAGGGIVGAPLFDAVLAARDLTLPRQPLRFIAGPFLPERAWQRLCEQAAARAGVEVVRHVPDMVKEMRAARASISQCGYNTALDVVVAGVPALMVPYSTVTENEQARRVERLAAAGAVLAADPADLAPAVLGARLQALLAFTPRPAALALDGARRTARFLAQSVRPVAPIAAEAVA